MYSMDEKSQIQALDRTHRAADEEGPRRHHDPRLPRPVRALNVLDGTVSASARHRHQEFLGFLRKLDRETPKLDLHLIVDNYATHKHAKVKLAKHPRFHFHFTPTSCPLAEVGAKRFFAEITRDAIRRGAFKSVPELEATINDYLAKTQRYSQTLRLDRHRPRHSRKDRSRTAGLEPCEGGYLLNESEH